MTFLNLVAPSYAVDIITSTLIEFVEFGNKVYSESFDPKTGFIPAKEIVSISISNLSLG